MPSSPEPVLLGRLLPLAFGAAVSPLLLLLQLLNLSAPAQPLRRSAAFLLGCTLVMTLWLLGAAWMAGLLAAVASGPVQLDAALDALFGLLLLAAAAWMLQSQPTSISPSAQPRAGAQGGLAAAFAAGLAAMGCNLTSLVLFPTLLHDLRGYPDTAIGHLIAARGMGNWAAFLVVARMTNLAPRASIALGMALQAGSGFWMATLDINLTDADVFWTNFLQGFGQSIAFTPMTVMAFSTLPPQRIPEGSAVFTLMRNFGSSLFISIVVLVLIRSTTINYARMAEFITPYNRTLALPGYPGQWDLESAAGLMRLSGELNRQASMIGYTNAFTLMALTAAVAMPLAFLMSRRPRDGAGAGRA